MSAFIFNLFTDSHAKASSLLYPYGCCVTAGVSAFLTEQGLSFSYPLLQCSKSLPICFSLASIVLCSVLQPLFCMASPVLYMS